MSGQGEEGFLRKKETPRRCVLYSLPLSPQWEYLKKVWNGKAREDQLTKGLVTLVLRYLQVWDLRRSRMCGRNKGWGQRGRQDAKAMTESLDLSPR